MHHALSVAVEILAAGAVITFIGTRLIERAHPPRGRFVDVPAVVANGAGR